MSNPEPRVTLSENPLVVYEFLGRIASSLRDIGNFTDCPMDISECLRTVAVSIESRQSEWFLFHKPESEEEDS